MGNAQTTQTPPDWDSNTHADSKRIMSPDGRSHAWTADTISTKHHHFNDADSCSADGTATSGSSAEPIGLKIHKYTYKIPKSPESQLYSTRNKHRREKSKTGTASKPILLVDTHPQSPNTVDVERLPMGGLASLDEYSRAQFKMRSEDSDEYKEISYGVDSEMEGVPSNKGRMDRVEKERKTSKDGRQRSTSPGRARAEKSLAKLSRGQRGASPERNPNRRQKSSPKKPTETKSPRKERGVSPEPNRNKGKQQSLPEVDWDHNMSFDNTRTEGSVETFGDTTIIESTGSQEGFEISQLFSREIGNLTNAMSSFMNDAVRGRDPISRKIDPFAQMVKHAVKAFSPTNSSPRRARLERAKKKPSQEKIEIDFVERYQATFIAFLRQYPHLAMNERMLDLMRIAKLAKIMDTCDEHEAALHEEIINVKKQRPNIIKEYQFDLAEASRKRATREITLKQELETIQGETEDIRTKLTWKIVESFERRALKESKLIARLQSERVNPNALISEVPDLIEATKIREAIKSDPKLRPVSDQERELLELQSENSILKDEVELFEKKLVYQYVCAKKSEWVEAILSKMNEDHLARLKERYETSRQAALPY